MTDSTPQSFVVLFEGRSGSTYTVEALDSHPRITAWKEYFATLKKSISEGKADESAQLEWAGEFLSGAYDDGRFASQLAIGFKTKFRDVLDPGGFADLIEQLGTRVILLHRRNRIKLLVSFFNGVRLHETTADWNLYDAHRRLDPFRIDPDDFASGLERVEGRHEKLERYVGDLSSPTHSVYYEDLLTDSEHTLAEIQRFLGVPVKSLAGDTVKNTSDDLREVLVNFDELRSMYVGTRYEPMFNEVLITNGGL